MFSILCLLADTRMRLIKKNCRDVDIPVRYGGEEFLIVQESGEDAETKQQKSEPMSEDENDSDK